MLTITSNTYEGRCLQLEVWEDSFDAAANTSQVCWRLQSLGGYSSYYYIADTAVILEGQTLWQYDAPAWDTNWAAKTFPVKTGMVEGQVTLPHNPDGKKTLTAQLHTRVYVSTTPAVFSGALTLTPIPRSSAVTAQDMVLGEPCRISWTASPGLYYKLAFVLGTRYQSYAGIYPNRTGEYTFRQFPLPAELARGLPNGREGELSVTLTAHRDAACTAEGQVGQAAQATCRVTVPDTFGPTLEAVFSPTGDLPEAFAGLYLQGKTGIRAGFAAQGQHLAAIQTYRLSAGGQSVTGGEGVLTIGNLTQYGSQSVTAAVQDSRGLEAAVTQVIQVLPYARPRILSPQGQSKVRLLRCDASGNADDSGAWLLLQARRSYSPVLVGGVQKNFCQVRCRLRPEGAAAWGDWVTLLEAADPSDQISAGPLFGTLDSSVSYQVQLQALDTLGEQGVTTLSLSTQRVYCHRSGARGSFAFGKLAEGDDVFDIAPDKTVILRGPLVLHPEAAQAVLDIAHPVGSVLETAAQADPSAALGGIWVSLTSPTQGLYRWQRTE